MSFFQYTGIKEKGGIPKNSSVIIVTFHGSHAVFKQKKIQGAVGMNFDPGKYKVRVKRKPDPKEPEYDVFYTDSFLVDLTEEQYQLLRKKRPRQVRAIFTSEGNRWQCTWPMCEDEFMHQIAAVIHEYEHNGVDLLAATDEQIAVADEKSLAMRNKQQQAKALKGGRNMPAGSR